MSCDFKSKVFSNAWHLQGFCPEWVLWWETSWSFLLKTFPHSQHSGILLCVNSLMYYKVLIETKSFSDSHCIHVTSLLCEFSNVQWGRTCCWSLSHIYHICRAFLLHEFPDRPQGMTLLLKAFPHELHSKDFRPICICWQISYDFLLAVFPDSLLSQCFMPITACSRLEWKGDSLCTWNPLGFFPA